MGYKVTYFIDTRDELNKKHERYFATERQLQWWLAHANNLAYKVKYLKPKIDLFSFIRGVERHDVID